MTTQRARPELELQSRYVFLGSLAEGRRVLDLGGDARGLLALAEAGASELTCCCDDPDAVNAVLSEAGVEGVDVKPAAALPLPFEDQAFDLIICHDLAWWLADNPEWATELRRVLDPAGYLALAIANQDGKRVSDLAGESFGAPFTYQEAFEKLAPTFGVLTLIGQSPVVANLFYDFESAAEEPGLVFDRSLLTEESEEAGWYVMIFGPEAVHRDDLTIVQASYPAVLAATSAGRGGAAAQPSEAANAGSVDASRLAALEEQVERFRRDRDVLASRLASQQDELDEARAALQRAREGAPIEEAVAEVSDANEAAQQVAAAQSRAEEALAQAEQNRAESEALKQQVQELSNLVEELRTQLADVAERLSQAATERDEAKNALQAERQTAANRAVGPDQSERIEELAQEAARQAKVRGSYETQIRDLLEEVSALRASEDTLRGELEQAKQATPMGSPEDIQSMRGERDELAKLLDQQQRKWDAESEQLRLESDTLRAGMEEARTAWETQSQELRRERDTLAQELEQAKSGATTSPPEGIDASEALRQRVVQLEAEKKALADELARAQEAARAQPAASPRPAFRDGVGRPVESSLEEIEDLIATSAPTRR